MNVWAILGTLLYLAVGMGYFRYATKTASIKLPNMVPLAVFLSLFYERAWQIFLFGSLISIFPPIHFYWRGP